MISVRIMKFIMPTSCEELENNFNTEMINQQKLLNEFSEFSHSKFATDYKQKRAVTTQKLLSGLKILYQSDFICIKFKTNQLINDLIVNSLLTIVKYNKTLDIQKDAFSLFNRLLTETCNDCISDNACWYNMMIRFFFQNTISNLKSIIEVQKLPNDHFFKDEIFSISNYLFDFIEFDDQLQTQFVFKMVTFLKSNTNLNNVDRLISVAEKVLIKMRNSRFWSFFEIGIFRIEILDILRILKNSIIFLMNDYEEQLVKPKHNLVTNYFCSIHINYRYDDIVNGFSDIYDKILVILTDKIEDRKRLKIETINFLSQTFELIVTWLKKSSKYYSRHEILLDLMVKIIHESSEYDLNKEVDFALLKMAYDVVVNFLLYKVADIESSYFFSKYWSKIEKSWLVTLKHKKSHIAFAIIPRLIDDFEQCHVDLMRFFLEKINEYMELKIKNNEKNIEDELLCILVSILSNNHKFKHNDLVMQMAISIVNHFFRIGKSMNLIEWDSFFRTINYEISDYDLIKDNNDSAQLYFDMTIKNMNVDTVKYLETKNPEYDWYDLASETFYFLSDFIDIFKQKLSNEIKFELVEFIDHLSAKNDSIKNLAERLLKSL